MRGGTGGVTVLCVVLVGGCAREHYRRGADAETGAILREKTCDTAWELPADFDPYPAAGSRLADPSNPDCPSLPPSIPRLHAYELPELNGIEHHPIDPDPGEVRRPNGSGAGSTTNLHDRLPESSALLGCPIPVIAGNENRASAVFLCAGTECLPNANADSFHRTSTNHVLLFGVVSPLSSEAGQDRAEGTLQSETGLPLLPIPESAWKALPNECLLRMLEFESVRREYRDSFKTAAGAEPRDTSRRLTLDNIVALALLNSREYQSSKEVLYRAALALTLERYEYQLKFSPNGNGTIVDYAHTRTNDTTVNTLDVTSTFGLQKMLATGGNMLARFANDVVLTFNGPQGFAADINSELFFGLTQSLLQRDVRFEPLIQAERDVIYAARDFARFRKVFFFDRASEYYALIRRYRQVEIESQNYLSLVRAFNQAEAEEQAGLQSRVQVEQIEQGMLGGRRNLVAICNGLESSLDRLKISMGIPTETAIGLNLDELTELNLRDETQVAAERVTRARRRMQSQRDKQTPDLGELLNSAIVLNDRLLDWLRLRQRGKHDVAVLRELELLGATLRVSDARLTTQRARDELQRARLSEPAAPPVLLFQRTSDVIEALRKLALQQVELATTLGADPQSIDRVRAANEQLARRAVQLHDRLDAVLKGAQVEQLTALTREAEQLLADLENQVRAADQLVDMSKPFDLDQQLADIQKQVDKLISHSEGLLEATNAGLVELEIQVEDAMLTALVSRLELMNERGRVADERRAIKITADDLRSVLNLGAEQTIRTRHNRPLDFTFDESETRLALALDLPLNRMSQRNAYRRALLDYQAALRILMGSEDNIKLAIRDELRDLALARTQYQISVASAALAAERVESTRLQLALGSAGVAARDFLDAQDSYRTALSAVADNHVGYVVSRARFFLDSELMQLDETGFWPELRKEDFQPVPRFDFAPNAGPPYGEVPDFIWLSHELRQVFDDQP
jgi:Outer membrane efflux protein